MRDSEVVAMIPMKPLALGKTRLSGRLTPPQRMALSLGMLRRVLRAFVIDGHCTSSATSVADVWVLGGDPEISRLARQWGATWFEEEGSDINETLWLGFRRAFASGKAALYLPGDLPFLNHGDVATMYEASGRLKNIVLAPARQDSGTNGILVPPVLPHSFRPLLGPDSFQRHLSQGESLGFPVAICYTPGLACDLDTAVDLEAYEDMEPGFLAGLTETAKPLAK